MQIGVSSFLWRQQHVVGHHTHTNLDSDPDIRASAQDVRRVAPHHQHHWYHVSVLKGLSLAAIGSFKTQMLVSCKCAERTFPSRHRILQNPDAGISIIGAWCVSILEGCHGCLHGRVNAACRGTSTSIWGRSTGCWWSRRSCWMTSWRCRVGRLGH